MMPGLGPDVTACHIRSGAVLSTTDTALNLDAFCREKEPWEATDGAVYMVRELAAVAPEALPEFLPGLADAARLSHFAHAVHLQENIWRQLPVMAQRMGKRLFKPFLEEFLEPLFRSLTSGNRLCEGAAGRCIGSLRDFLGGCKAAAPFSTG